MLVPVMPTVAFLGFAGFAARFGLRRRWQNAVICLLGGAVAFLAIERLTSRPGVPDQDRARMVALEHRITALEAQVQRLQSPNAGK